VTYRLRAAVKASIALAAAAATPHLWVAVPTLLYALRLAVGEARRGHVARTDQEHPHA
jgi:hypothetical protein